MLRRHHAPGFKAQRAWTHCALPGAAFRPVGSWSGLALEISAWRIQLVAKLPPYLVCTNMTEGHE